MSELLPEPIFTVLKPVSLPENFVAGVTQLSEPAFVVMNPVYLAEDFVPGPVAHHPSLFRIQPTQVAVPGPPGTGTGDGEPEKDVKALAALLVHEADATPHPAYDDLLDLTLLFENGLV